MLAEKCEIGTAESGSKQFHNLLFKHCLFEGNYVNHYVVAIRRDTLYNLNTCYTGLHVFSFMEASLHNNLGKSCKMRSATCNHYPGVYSM